jgi:hypothetical protein
LEKGIREFERKKGDVATCVSFPLGRSAFDFFSASVTNLSLGALRRFFPLIFGWTIFVKKTTHQKIGGFDPSSLFGFDDMTFKLKRVDNTDAVINFYPKKGEGTKPYYLMHALVAELKKEGKRNGEWIETLVKRERIIDLIKKQCPNENNVDSNWIKNTKGNLIKKIPQEYEGLIKIGDFNHKLKGYPFSLKIPF